MALLSRVGRWTLAGAAVATLALPQPSQAERRMWPQVAAMHPMDGLTTDEIRSVTDVLRGGGKFDDATRVVSMALDEDPKDEVRAWRPGQPFMRRAIATLLQGGHLYEAHIDLAARRLLGGERSRREHDCDECEGQG